MGKMVLGLIGSIGSGKSRVAELLAARGARVVSGDEAGHEALAQPEIRDQIVRHFGKGVLAPDGAIDRRKLGAIVFADPMERKALEAMVFPFIRRRLQEKIDEAQRDDSAWLIVLDAAVLLEAGWDDRCDMIVLVDAPREVRLARVARQRGWTEADLSARENAQLPMAAKVARARGCIKNAGSEEDLIRAVEQLLSSLKKHLW